jgi:hypothetical protein
MPAFQLNDSERAAMRGQSLLVRSVYVFGLRPYMDYRTGLVGAVRGISYQSIAEELYVEPGAGVKDSGSPTVRQLERAIERLEHCGLVQRDAGANGRRRQLVFCLPKATSDESAKNKVVAFRWTDVVGDVVGLQASNGEGCSGIEGVEVVGSKTAEVVLPPVSGNTPPPPREQSPLDQPMAGRFPMHDNWVPGEKGWKATLMRNQLTADALNTDALIDFRSYWINQPDKYQTQGQWEHALAQNLKRDMRHQQAGQGGNRGTQQTQKTKAGQRTDRPGAGTPAERVRAAIDQREAAEKADGEAMAADGGNVRAPLDGEFWRHAE